MVGVRKPLLRIGCCSLQKSVVSGSDDSQSENSGNVYYDDLCKDSFLREWKLTSLWIKKRRSEAAWTMPTCQCICSLSELLDSVSCCSTELHQVLFNISAFSRDINRQAAGAFAPSVSCCTLCHAAALNFSRCCSISQHFLEISTKNVHTACTDAQRSGLLGGCQACCTYLLLLCTAWALPRRTTCCWTLCTSAPLQNGFGACCSEPWRDVADGLLWHPSCAWLQGRWAIIMMLVCCNNKDIWHRPLVPLWWH